MSSINSTDPSLVQKPKKKDFEEYIIEKYQALKGTLSDSNIKNETKSPCQQLSNRNHFNKLGNRDSSLSLRNPISQEQSSRLINSVDNSILKKKNQKDGVSKINFSLYYNGLEESLSKYGIKVNRYNDKLSNILETSPINQNIDQLLPTLKLQTSSNAITSRKRSFNSHYMGSDKSPDSSVISEERKNNFSMMKQNSAEENLKTHIQKKLLKEMQTNCLKNDNFYDRIKNFPVNIEECINQKQKNKSVDQNSILNMSIQRKNSQQRTQLPLLNFKSLSQDSRISISNPSSYQIIDSTFRNKFLNLESIRKHESKEMEYNSSENSDSYGGKNIFNTSIDEIKTQEFNEEKEDSFSNRNMKESQESGSKFTEDNTMVNSSLRVYAEHENIQKQVSEQNSPVTLPFQRQWAIFSPFTRKSPFQSQKLPQIKKSSRLSDNNNSQIVNQKQNHNRNELKKRNQQQQTFSRDPFFDIHFNSFEHRLKKLKGKLQVEDYQKLNDLTTTSTFNQDELQSSFKIKRKASIFRQNNVPILTKINLQKAVNYAKNYVSPLSSQSQWEIKRDKDETIPQQRFIKPYPAFIRQGQQQQGSSNSINNGDMKSQDAPRLSVYKNLKEVEKVEEDTYTLNEKLIEGLEYNIDRFITVLKQKIKMNSKLEDEIKQECYIFDFEQFIRNFKMFIVSSISKKPIVGVQSNISFSRNSILFDGINTTLPQAFKLSLLAQPKLNINEMFSLLLRFKFGQRLLTENDNVPSAQQKQSNYMTKNTQAKMSIYDASFNNSIQFDCKNEKQEQQKSSLSRTNSIPIVSPRVADIKNQHKQMKQFSPQRGNHHEPSSFSESIQRKQSLTKSLSKSIIINTSFSDHNQFSQVGIPSLKEEKLVSEQDVLSKSLHKKDAIYVQKGDELSVENNYIQQKQIESRRKEEEVFLKYMQIGLNELENYSKSNLKLTQNVFDQLLAIIMDILIEFQFSNLSINQYMGSLQQNASAIVESSVKSELPKHLFDKLISTTVGKMELQSKMNTLVTKFLQTLFEVEEEVVIQRHVLDTSVNDTRSMQLLHTVNEIAQQCQLNFLQFYSLKLFLFETMKDIQANFKTIQKALSCLEAFRFQICDNQNNFIVEKDQQSSNKEKEDNEFDWDQVPKKKEEYLIDFASKKSIRKLIDELEWVLQNEMVEVIQSDNKSHHEMQLFISDLVFCLVGIYPYQQIVYHKNLKILNKNFFDQVIYYLCQLLFKKKMPLEVIRNIFIASYQLSTILNFESKLINQIGGFIPILQLSFILSSANFMDEYKTKCSVSSNVTLIQKQYSNNQSEQKQEEDNTSLIVTTIQSYQLTWMEFLFACYFSSSPCYNTYDLKAALMINKVDQNTIHKWIEYLNKLAKYFDKKCLEKFGQELSISSSYLK